MRKEEEVTETTLGKYVGTRGKSIEPAKQPNDWFELYSVPSHPTGAPEIVLGAQIGSNKQVVEPGSVLLCKINPRINRTWVVGSHSDNPKIASTEWIVFPPSDDYEPKFLAYYLQQETVRSFLASNASGVGGSLMRVKPSTLSSFPFLLPSSLATQREIVAKLDEQFSRLDAGVAALRRAQANLKRYRASVLKAACEGRLVPTEASLAREEVRRAMEERGEWKPGMDSSLIPLPSSFESGSQLLNRILAERRTSWSGKGKYKPPTPPDTTNLPELPEGWVMSTIGCLCEVFVGATPSRKEPSFWNGDIPWVSSGEVAFCRILSTRESITERGLMKTSTELHPPGTILIGMIGEGKTRGQVAMLGITACNNQNSAAIRVPKGLVAPEYVYYYLYGKYQETRGVSSGNNQPALNKARVSDMPMPLPPYDEQSRIIAEIERRMSVVDELDASATSNLQRGTRYKQAVLQRTFQ